MSYRCFLIQCGGYNMSKAIIVDLDRTLLHSDKTVSKYSLSVLNQCHRKNIKVVFATARPVRTVKPYLEHIFCDAVIYHNGAFTISDSMEIGQSYRIPIVTARRILSNLCKKYPYKELSIEISDTLYANFDVKEFWSYTNAIISDFSDLPNVDADKIIVEIDSKDDYNATVGFLAPELYGQISDGNLCLIMNRRATKLNAIKGLSKYWNLTMSQFTSFGDDYNDIEMIRHCGIGVAVGNAIKEVMQVADSVTDTNDNDGVAKYISKYLL